MLVKDILPKKGIDAVSPLATMEGPPMYTIARLSMNEECGAKATTGAEVLVDCFPRTLRRNPPTMKTQRISRAHNRRTILSIDEKYRLVIHYLFALDVSIGKNGTMQRIPNLHLHSNKMKAGHLLLAEHKDVS